MKKNGKPKILVAVSHRSHIQLALRDGAESVLRNYPDWDVRFVFPFTQNPHQTLKVVLSWKPDVAIIYQWPGDYGKSPEQALGCPVISMLKYLEGISAAYDIDQESVGHTIAEHLLFLNAEKYAFIHAGSDFEKVRKNAFQSFLKKENRDCDTYQFSEEISYQIHQLRWHMQDKKFGEWLLSLPKPVAIGCSHDMLAFEVYQWAGKLHLSIPADLIILGANNHPMCEKLEISSVEIPWKQIGILSAQTAVKFLNGDPSYNPGFIKLKASIVSERASTSVCTSHNPVVSRAAALLETKLEECGTVAALAVALSMNRRALERAFASELNISPHEFILKSRVNSAKQLLRETDLSIAEIAEKCSLTEKRLYTVFHKKTGYTPRNYRICFKTNLKDKDG